ncbi:MAG: hypothetical protein AAFY51_09215 [Pseudomonadota bacterium]
MSISNDPIHRGVFAAGLAFAISASASAQDIDTEQAMDDAKDIAETPLEDIGLAKDEIPEELVETVKNPYSRTGTENCRGIIDQVDKLNEVLGDDIDVIREKNGQDIDTTKAAKSLVGSIIPFRGIVREISGAADNKRKAQAAIVAGMVRRGYLKGLGQSRGCKYPGRPKSN